MRSADKSFSRRGLPNPSSRSLCGHLLSALGVLLICFPSPAAAEENADSELLLAANASPLTHRIETHDDGRELHIAGAEGEEERLLVGAIIRGKEAGSIEVLRIDGRYQVPLEPFAELTRTDLEWTEDRLRLETPFGAVELESTDLLEIDGTRYLSETLLENRLATPILFDAEQFALVFDLPWRPELVDAENLAPSAPDPEPDALPPRASLSTIRIQASSTTTDTETRLASTTTVGGRLASGFWRLRYEDDFEGRNELREYSWLRTAGRQRYLVGQQRPHVHPLLESLEFTGLQVASTNQPLELFSPTPEFGELLSRRLQPLTSVRGDGPPAGLAELRIDGEVIAQQVIGLDGRYEFLEIPLESRRLSRLEVLLFDRHNLSVPVAIHEKSQSANDLLLAPGARILLGGAGREGNLLVDDDSSARGVGFLQWRQGITPRLTVEAAVQEGRESRRAVAGLIGRLGRDTVLSFASARSEEGLGYDLTVERLRGRWRLLAQSRWLEEGFLSPEAAELFNHDVEVGYRTARLDLALIGRSSRDADRREEHLLPAIAWRPTNRLFLRARPDRFGDYRYDLAYRFGSRARLGASYQDRLSLDFTTRLRNRYYLTLDGQWGDDQPDRYSAIVRWFDPRGWRPNWSAGLLYSEGGDEVGYLAGVTTEVRDGLRARVEISNPEGTSDGHQVFVGLTANLALARGRLLSGRRRAVRDDRGAIAGRVRPDLPAGFPSYPLGELRIFLDGKLVTTTEPDGTFFVGNLEEGIHRIELDPENLPLELVPRRLALNAEVASAAVTRVDFEVIPEFGIAGRLTDGAGEPLTEITLRVLDTQGVVVGQGRTDRFGYYRIDRLAPGSYTVEVAPGELDETGEIEREFEIRDDFLFGVDLKIER